jgi:hypothetical protein
MSSTGRSNPSDVPSPLPGDHPDDPTLAGHAVAFQDADAGAAGSDDQAVVALPPLSAAEVVSLEKIVRWVPPALVGYLLIAAALVLLALRRGRLFDAILIVTTLLLTIPPILGYRAQARGRLHSFFRGGDATAASPAAEKQPSSDAESGGPT